MDRLKTTGGEVKYLDMATIRNCPTLIMLASHYREGGSCRHDEPNCEDMLNGVRCINPKYRDEIFCSYHLIESYGLTQEDLDDATS